MLSNAGDRGEESGPLTDVRGTVMALTTFGNKRRREKKGSRLSCLSKGPLAHEKGKCAT